MSKEEFHYVGKSIPPKELFEKVTGRFQYVGDMHAELYGKILRSPHPHALIKRIDASKVEKLSGVEAVLTHKDVPPRKMPRRDQRGCYILEDHLRFVGDEVAAVAAKTRAIAEEALDLVSAFFFSYQGVNASYLSLSSYPYRGDALAFVGFGSLFMVTASLSFTKRSKTSFR